MADSGLRVSEVLHLLEVGLPKEGDQSPFKLFGYG
jgi:hypothetical protein